MHFSSLFTTMEDWSRHKPQTTDNMFPSSLALPGQPLQQPTTPIQAGVSGAQRNSNAFLDGQFHDFMPYQPFQQLDGMTMNHLQQQPIKSPSQPLSSPQIQQQLQQQQLHQHHLQLQQQQHLEQQQAVQQHSWADQRYTQTYMPMTTNSIPMGQPAYYNQQQQQPTSHHMQQQHIQQRPMPPSQHLQQRSMSSSQHMPYHQMLPHQQQAFLGSLNPSSQQLHYQYPGLNTHKSSSHRIQQLHQSEQSGRKRKEANEYMDNAMAIPMKKPKKKKKKVKEPEYPNAPPKPKRKTGLNKPLILSAPLSALMDDETELSRPEIVKRLWKYIKGNDLQDPKDRRFILCDSKLKAIFHVDRVNSFGMNRDLSLHLTKKEPTQEQSSAQTTYETIKQSPTVTAETPDDVVTPQEGEHVLTKPNNSLAANPSTFNSASNSPSFPTSLIPF